MSIYYAPSFVLNILYTGQHLILIITPWVGALIIPFHRWGKLRLREANQPGPGLLVSNLSSRNSSPPLSTSQDWRHHSFCTIYSKWKQKVELLQKPEKEKRPLEFQNYKCLLVFSLSSTGEWNGNPLQCSCLENPRDGGAWWAAVSGVSQSWTRLKQLSSSSSSSNIVIYGVYMGYRPNQNDYSHLWAGRSFRVMKN